MGQFLDINEPPKLNEDEINNLYRHITPSEIERVIKNLITKKNTPGPDGFNAELSHSFKEEFKYSSNQSTK